MGGISNIQAEDFSEMTFCSLLHEKIGFIEEFGYSSFLWNYRQILNAQQKFRIFVDPDVDAVYYAPVGSAPLVGLDVTDMVRVMFRYVFLKEVLLAGQDAEFNIYRSYYL